MKSLAIFFIQFFCRLKFHVPHRLQNFAHSCYQLVLFKSSRVLILELTLGCLVILDNYFIFVLPMGYFFSSYGLKGSFSISVLEILGFTGVGY